MKIAIYDFCDTLVDFQTADCFVFYVLEHLGMRAWYNNLTQIDLLKKCINKSRLINKKIVLYQLKGIKVATLERLAEDYYNNIIKNHLQIPVVKQLEEYKTKGFKIYIVSAGYSIYLKHFAREYLVDELIANDFKYRNERFTGKMALQDCYGKEKCRRLEKEINGLNIEESVSISDCISDLPILKWADTGIVISKKQHRKWVHENGFEELVLADL